jgi:16S rRNA processing protein RimM
LRGALYVPGGDLRELDPGEFWEHEVLGATVVTSDGEEVGRVLAVDHGPGQDRFVVGTERGERYVPIVREIVVDVDTSQARVTIDPPSGLLD